MEGSQDETCIFAKKFFKTAIRYCNFATFRVFSY